jgi:uncharacterized protein YxeA
MKTILIILVGFLLFVGLVVAGTMLTSKYDATKLVKTTVEKVGKDGKLSTTTGYKYTANKTAPVSASELLTNFLNEKAKEPKP